MTNQLISILVPAYNASRWIRDCLESALAQDWRNKEIIVVDDGSRDSTLEIAQSFASSGVRVVTQENHGVCSARNRALRLSQGDYIQWLDSDDILAPDKISRQMESAEPGGSSRILLSGSWGQFSIHPDRSRFLASPLWEDLSPTDWLFRKVDGNYWMAIESWLVSRKLTEMAGPWDETLTRDDDGEYFCRVLACSERIRFVREARCYCRNRASGISHDLTLNDDKLDSQVNSLLAHIRILRSFEDSPKTRSACLKLLNRWSFYFYPQRPDLMSRLQAAAKEMGHELDAPELRKKYRWIKRIFGWSFAKKMQNAVPAARSQVEAAWEKLFARKTFTDNSKRKPEG